MCREVRDKTPPGGRSVALFHSIDAKQGKTRPRYCRHWRAWVSDEERGALQAYTLPSYSPNIRLSATRGRAVTWVECNKGVCLVVVCGPSHGVDGRVRVVCEGARLLA